MYEDLRNQSSFIEEEEPNSGQPEKKPRKRRDTYFLGMTAPQRFVIALTLLFMVCALGGFCLILSGRIYLPFL